MKPLKHLNLPEDRDESFPFSQAVVCEALVFVAGQLASDDPAWRGPGGDIALETEAAMNVWSVFCR